MVKARLLLNINTVNNMSKFRLQNQRSTNFLTRSFFFNENLQEVLSKVTKENEKKLLVIERCNNLLIYLKSITL